MKKRLLSILIRCCMVSMMLTLLPVTTYAESGAADVETQLKAVDEAKTERSYAELLYGTATPSNVDKLENRTPKEQYSLTTDGARRFPTYYTIKASAEKGGTITPRGALAIREGKDRLLVIKPDKGYAILDVKVDGTSVGPVKSYTFENVSENHTIDASFIKIKLRGIPTLSKNAITFGEALDTIRLSGKLYDDANNVDVDGTFEWKDGRIKPDANDNYQAEWKFTPEDTETYEETSGTVIITVNKATGRILNRSGQKQKYTDSSDHTYMPDWSKLPSGQEWSYSSEYSVSNGSAARITRHDVAVADGKLTYAVSGGVAGDVISFRLCQ